MPNVNGPTLVFKRRLLFQLDERDARNVENYCEEGVAAGLSLKPECGSRRIAVGLLRPCAELAAVQRETLHDTVRVEAIRGLRDPNRECDFECHRIPLGPLSGDLQRMPQSATNSLKINDMCATAHNGR